METNRQKKAATIFKEELSEIFRKEASEHFPGYLLTVSNVSISPDLSVAKVNLSIFPSKNKEEIIKQIKEKTPFLYFHKPYPKRCELHLNLCFI